MCPKCAQNLEIYSPYCYHCKQTSPDFSVHERCAETFPHILQTLVLTRYRQAPVKKLLRHGKYYRKWKCYEDIIIPHADFFESFVHNENAILVPVPMHWSRQLKRGYNHAHKIANILSNILDIPLRDDIVKKSRPTRQQSRLSRDDRQANLANTFSLISRDIPTSTHIYLVDDIISTGSTVLEIATMLAGAGYRQVSVIALASD